jgi:hypothetical protein
MRTTVREKKSGMIRKIGASGGAEEGINESLFAPRLQRRLGKGNRRTDVQRIRGEATNERISTDLDCIKNRLWGVQPVNLF